MPSIASKSRSFWGLPLLFALSFSTFGPAAPSRTAMSLPSYTRVPTGVSEAAVPDSAAS